jgi:N-acetylmuramoyl-L-alanine amidase
MKRVFILIISLILSLNYAVFAQREIPAVQTAGVSNKPTRPKIVSRKKWNAEDAVGKAKKQKIRFITIHHTATVQNAKLTIEEKMRSLQRFSQNEGRLASGKAKPAWFDIPYHYYISFDGKIAEGRKIKFVGDTNTEYDPARHALIVLEGNFQTEEPTALQQESLQKLVAWLALKWKVPPSEIKAHNDYAATACPGENLKKLLPALRQSTDELIRAAEKR